MTARNAYDLLPTIRSRAVPFHFARLSDAEMRAFLSTRSDVDQPERRLKLAEGSPGLAVSIDLEAYDRRRTAMLALLKVACGVGTFWRVDETFRLDRGPAQREDSNPIWKCCTRCWRTWSGWPTAARTCEIRTSTLS